jgi:hypothetical protein
MIRPSYSLLLICVERAGQSWSHESSVFDSGILLLSMRKVRLSMQLKIPFLFYVIGVTFLMQKQLLAKCANWK